MLQVQNEVIVALSLWLISACLEIVANFQGTLDKTNLIVTPAALDFYQALGGQAVIASYVEPLIEWAADMLAEALDTFRMQVPKSMEAPFMRIVGRQIN